MTIRSALSAHRSALIASLIVLLVAALAIDATPVGAVRDDAMYVVLAKALATGQGYHWINVPGAPPATHFPPGYPALLSLVWHIVPTFPANVMVFKYLNAVLVAIAAGVLVEFARRRLGFSPAAAIAAVIAGAIAVPTLVLSTIVMSEMLFLALLVPTLWLAERVATEDASDRQSALLGILGGALMLVRSHGIAFVAAMVVALVIRRRWRSAVVAGAVAAAVVAPWQMWLRLHRGVVPEAMRGDYESYSGWLSAGAHGSFDGWLQMTLRTVTATSHELFGMFVAVTGAGLPGATVRLAAGSIVILGMLFGLWRLRARSIVTALFVAAYLAIVLLWPFTPARFVWGVWPIITLVAAFGAREAWSTWSARSTRVVIACASGLVIVGYAGYNVRGYRGRWWSSIPRQTAALIGPSLLWVNANTGPNDVVSTNADAAIYLYTGRRTVPATRFSVDDYFAPPTVRSAGAALRSILGAYPVSVVAIVANDSLEAAARRMIPGGPSLPPRLSLRDSVAHGLIFTSIVR
jgi:hypothetical protein